MLPKDGYKTTEFWVSLAATLLGSLMAYGVFPEDSPWFRIAGAVGATLSALGYTWSRTKVKESMK